MPSNLQSRGNFQPVRMHGSLWPAGKGDAPPFLALTGARPSRLEEKAHLGVVRIGAGRLGRLPGERQTLALLPRNVRKSADKSRRRLRSSRPQPLCVVSAIERLIRYLTEGRLYLFHNHLFFERLRWSSSASLESEVC
jgi:hypothetical protein